MKTEFILYSCWIQWDKLYFLYNFNDELERRGGGCIKKIKVINQIDQVILDRIREITSFHYIDGNYCNLSTQ